VRAALCLVVAACGAAPAVELPDRCDSCVDLFVSAHEDDDLLFMNPDIADAIADDHQVTVAYTTAGDLGDAASDAYWIDRERGELQAYTYMLTGESAPAYDGDHAAIAAGWTASLVQLAGMTAVQYERDHVTLVFLRLSDFQEQCLWEQHGGCSSLNTLPAPPYLAITRACPGNADACPAGTAVAQQQVTRDQLIDALAELMVRSGAQTVGALDATDLHVDALGEAASSGDEAGYFDHWDHVFSARFALEAAMRVPAAPPAVRLYRGYTLHRADVDLADDVARAKQEAFARYAMFDTSIVKPPTPASYLGDLDKHMAGDYRFSSAGSWERRRIAAATLAPTTGALATAAGACLGLDLTAVACAGAPAWELTAERTLRSPTAGACVAVDDATGTATLGGCDSAILPLDNGQLRAPGGGCLALAPGGALAAAPCAAEVSAGHVLDAPLAAQAWSLDAD
jgi:LmbE family N-acetylglucosaminyl deacetylase